MTGDSRETLTPDAIQGCSFLRADELEALLDDSLERARRRAVEDHASRGCAACALLLEDARVYAESLRGELSAHENEVGSRDIVAARRAVAPVREAPPRGTRGWGLLAAALAALAIVGVLLPWGAGLRDAGPTRFELELPDGGVFEIALEEFSAPSRLRGVPSPEELWSEAGTLYRRGRFERAAALLGELSARDESGSDAPFYEGLAWLAASRPEDALVAFDEALRRIRRAGDPDDVALWYRAVAQLAARGVTSARPDLAAVASSEGPYAPRARALLDRLSGSEGRQEGEDR